MSEISSSSGWPDDVVKPFKAWCQAAGISPATGRRLIASGNGPTITRLSTRRIGIRGRHHRAWLDQRASPNGSASSSAKFADADRGCDEAK
jgi:hypothetical protein